VTPENRQERWRAFLQNQDPMESAVRAGGWIVTDADLRGASQELRSRPMPRGRGRPTKATNGLFHHNAFNGWWLRKL
jgi:hypothetical protein